MSEFVFPQDAANDVFADKFQRTGGMALRDYFAAQCMSAMIMAASGKDLVDAMGKAATMAYAAADAMIGIRHAKAKSDES